MSEFSPDWDKLEACRDSLREHMAMVKGRDKQISELYNALQSMVAAFAGGGVNASQGEKVAAIQAACDALKDAGREDAGSSTMRLTGTLDRPTHPFNLIEAEK